MTAQFPDWRERNRWLWQKTDGHCAYCGLEFQSLAQMTVDHVVPRSQGGDHARANKLPCCRPCNSAKRDRPLSYLRDIFQRRAHGRPAFTQEQREYLALHGFTFPNETPFQFYWEKLGNSFDVSDDA